MIPLICDAPPEYITVGDRKIGITGDYRRWLIVYEILCSDMPSGMKASLCAECVVSDGAVGDEDCGAFLDACTAFLLRRESDADTAPRTVKRMGETAFDFSADSGLILASFLSEYGIDLTKERMHWYKFMALLTSLPPTSPLMRTVALRTADLSLIEDDGVRRRLRRAKKAVEIRKKERSDDEWTVR